MISLSLLMPPTGTLSLPVANWSSLRLLSIGSSCTADQKWRIMGLSAEYPSYSVAASKALKSKFCIHSLVNKPFAIDSFEKLTLLPQTNCSTSSGLKSICSGDSSVTILKPFLNAENCLAIDLFSRKSAYRSTNSYKGYYFGYVRTSFLNNISHLAIILIDKNLISVFFEIFVESVSENILVTNPEGLHERVFHVISFVLHQLF
jgi:hypothetical protein